MTTDHRPSDRRRFHRAALAGLAAALAGPRAMAQSTQAGWPARPVRVVVPYTPGGFTDTMARSIGEALSRATSSMRRPTSMQTM